MIGRKPWRGVDLLEWVRWGVGEGTIVPDLSHKPIYDK
jgi:hypothetical protein